MPRGSLRAVGAGDRGDAGSGAKTGGVCTGADDTGGSGAGMGAGVNEPEGRVSKGRDSMLGGRSGAD